MGQMEKFILLGLRRNLFSQNFSGDMFNVNFSGPNDLLN